MRSVQRSFPFRPNPIGMLLIELKNLIIRGNEVGLALGSLDLVDGSPVIDIKPYLPFAESLPKAVAGFAQAAPASEMKVLYSINFKMHGKTEKEAYYSCLLLGRWMHLEVR